MKGLLIALVVGLTIVDTITANWVPYGHGTKSMKKSMKKSRQYQYWDDALPVVYDFGDDAFEYYEHVEYGNSQGKGFQVNVNYKGYNKGYKGKSWKMKSGLYGKGYKGKGYGYKGKGYKGYGYKGKGYNGKGFKGKGYKGQGFKGKRYKGKGFKGTGYKGKGKGLGHYHWRHHEATGKGFGHYPWRPPKDTGKGFGFPWKRVPSPSTPFPPTVSPPTVTPPVSTPPVPTPPVTTPPVPTPPVTTPPVQTPPTPSLTFAPTRTSFPTSTAFPTFDIEPECFDDGDELRDAAAIYVGTDQGARDAVVALYGPISAWCVGQVTDFSEVFNGASEFNEDIGDWVSAFWA